MPLGLPLGYSSVQSNALMNFSYRWTRELRVPTLPLLTCVLRPDDSGTLFPTVSSEAFESPNSAAGTHI